MDTLPFLVILAVGLATFALLSRKRSGVAMAALAAINAAGIAALAWLAATVVIHDRDMFEEQAICFGLIAALAIVTWGGYALARRGWVWAGLVLLALAALPVTAAYGFIFYLDAHPIAWH